MILRLIALLLLTFLSFGCVAPSGSPSGTIAWGVHTDFPSPPVISDSTERISPGTVRIQTASCTGTPTGESFVAARTTFPKPLDKSEQNDVAAGITNGLLRGFGGSGKVTSRRTVQVVGKPALRMTLEFGPSANTMGECIVIPDGNMVYTFFLSRQSGQKPSPAGKAFLRNIRRR